MYASIIIQEGIRELSVPFQEIQSLNVKFPSKKERDIEIRLFGMPRGPGAVAAIGLYGAPVEAKLV